VRILPARTQRRPQSRGAPEPSRWTRGGHSAHTVRTRGALRRPRASRLVPARGHLAGHSEHRGAGTLGAVHRSVPTRRCCGRRCARGAVVPRGARSGASVRGQAWCRAESAPGACPPHTTRAVGPHGAHGGEKPEGGQPVLGPGVVPAGHGLQERRALCRMASDVA
jgi:hypothetical protein